MPGDIQDRRQVGEVLPWLPQDRGAGVLDNLLRDKTTATLSTRRLAETSMMNVSLTLRSLFDRLFGRTLAPKIRLWISALLSAPLDHFAMQPIYCLKSYRRIYYAARSLHPLEPMPTRTPAADAAINQSPRLLVTHTASVRPSSPPAGHEIVVHAALT